MLPRIAEVGRLWKDPEIRYTPQGKAVCTLPLVFSKRKKGDDGKWVDDASLFVRGTVWDQQAEHAANSLSKGDNVFVTGELFQREYDDKEGQKRQSLELRVYEVGPSMKWNDVEVRRVERSSQSGAPADDPWANTADEAPF